MSCPTHNTKVPSLAYEDTLVGQRRRFHEALKATSPKNRLIDLDNCQPNPYLVHPYIFRDSVEDRLIYSIERKMFFLLLVGIDYKAFDKKGSFFIKTKE